jgi:hypothetical protein
MTAVQWRLAEHVVIVVNDDGQRAEWHVSPNVLSILSVEEVPLDTPGVRQFAIRSPDLEPEAKVRIGPSAALPLKQEPGDSQRWTATVPGLPAESPLDVEVWLPSGKIGRFEGTKVKRPGADDEGNLDQETEEPEGEELEVPEAATAPGAPVEGEDLSDSSAGVDLTEPEPGRPIPDPAGPGEDPPLHQSLIDERPVPPGQGEQGP